MSPTTSKGKNIMKKAIIISIIVVSIFGGFCYKAHNTMEKNIQAKLIPAPSDSASSQVFEGAMLGHGAMDLIAIK